MASSSPPWPTAARPTTLAPGVDFFKNLADSGNLLPVDPNPATIASGQTPIVIDWTYNKAPRRRFSRRRASTWKTVIP